LWLGTRNGLNYFEPQRGDFVYFLHDDSNLNSIGSNMVRHIIEDDKGLIWVVFADNGIDLFDHDHKTFTHIRNETGNPASLAPGGFRQAFEDNSGNVWFCSDYHGLMLYDRHLQRFEHYTKSEGKANSLSSETILSICEDHSGEIWVGTDKGLDRFDKEGKTVTHYEHEPGNPNSLNHNIISELYEDSSGILWVGTYGGGLHYFVPERNAFVKFISEKDNLQSLSDNTISAITEDKYGFLWITTIAGGVNRYDHENNIFTQYYSENRDSYPRSSKNCISILEDKHGVIWIGTNGNGLNRYDRESDTFKLYSPKNRDSTGIGTGFVRAICEDAAGNLWLGTNIGLDKFDRTTEVFTHYREKDGLSNNFICGILEDERGNLWISTSTGIDKFDPVSETFINYDKQDGLQSDEFLHDACYKTEDGRMYFGGVNGFNVFHPDSIRQNKYIPPVVLTEFLLFNKSVSIGKMWTNPEKKFPLQQSINIASEVTLDYTDYIFGFEFTALNYIKPQKNQFAYMLEGFNKDWVYVDYLDRKADFTNIPPGEYAFRVKASNDDGYWNEEGTSLKVIILPPWWLTWWAKTLYVIFIAGSLLLIYFGRVSSLKKQQRKLEYQVKERTIEVVKQKEEIETQHNKLIELDNFKESMTGMIVHDLKNPLNAILNLTKDKSLSQMSKQMLNMVLNILDVQKFEDSKMILDKREFSISKISAQSVQEVSFLSQRKNIFIINTIPNYAVKMDAEIMERVFVNLLSNGIKYSKPDGKIEISGFEDQPGFIRIEISDHGEGIPKDKLEHVFEKFGQVKAKKSGRIRSTGLGLTFCKLAIEAHGGTIGVQSDIGEGTVFFFTVPGRKSDETSTVSESTSLFENKLIRLTEEDKKFLSPLINKLRNYEVYEITSIEKILKQLDFSISDSLKIWKEEITTAIYNGNKDKFYELLEN